jgi:hypothetical protein
MGQVQSESGAPELVTVAIAADTNAGSTSAKTRFVHVAILLREEKKDGKPAVEESPRARLDSLKPSGIDASPGARCTSAPAGLAFCNTNRLVIGRALVHR